MTIEAMIPVYLESTPKRAFAGTLDWPGWTRSGADEAAALAALAQYAARYARVAQIAGLEFPPAVTPADFTVVERLKGGSGVDYGAIEKPPSVDALPAEGAELERLQALLAACWQFFAGVVQAARGKELRTGPRGGGRDLEKAAWHVLEAERSYLSRLGWKTDTFAGLSVNEGIARARAEAVLGMAAKERGELPELGPRGGQHWSLRYYVRRSAWHVLDHAWEIEDRVI